MYAYIGFRVTNRNFLAQYELQTAFVVSPTLIVNLTLLVIPCNKQLGIIELQ